MLKTTGLSVLLFGMSNDSSFEQSRLSCGYLITQLYSIQLLLLVEHSQPNFNRFAFLLETFAFYVIPIVKAKPKLQVSNYSSISLIRFLIKCLKRSCTQEFLIFWAYKKPVIHISLFFKSRNHLHLQFPLYVFIDDGSSRVVTSNKTGTVLGIVSKSLLE